MTTPTEFFFAARYEIEDVGSAHGSAAVVAADNVSTSAPRVVLAVTNADGVMWEGEFFGGSDPLDLVASTPDQDVFLVVAGGVGYLARPADPRAYTVVPMRPIQEVHSCTTARITLCVGLTKLLAIGLGGEIAWISSALAPDGFSEVRVGSDVAVVRAWRPEVQATAEVTIDLRSGAIVSEV
jgi:hypothetical protein